MLGAATIALGLGCAIAVTLCGQAPKRGAQCHLPVSATRRIPETMLEKPIALRSDIGLVHEPVTTHSQAAQQYYDQGLTLLYAYDWIDAARSFKEALRRNQKLAMAHLGLSFVFSGLADNVSAASEEAQAQSLAPFASKLEASRIELRRQQLQSIRAEQQGDKNDGYAIALAKALSTQPSNTQFLLLTGNAAEGTASGRGQRGTATSIVYYKQILRNDPRNPVAHHFLVHSYEMLNDIDQAVEHAKIFIELAPSLPHAHHMYGHELLRAGRIQEAVSQFKQAEALAEKSWADSPQARTYDWHYRHNLNLLAAAYRQAGKSDQAEITLRKLASLPGRSEVDEYYQTQLAAFLLQQGRRTETIKALRQYLKPRTHLGFCLQHLMKGSAFAHFGTLGSSALELSTAEQHLRSVDPGWQPFLQPWIEVLRAQLDIERSKAAVASSRLIHDVQSLNSSNGTDGWSEALFHIEYVGKIAVHAQLWDVARLSSDRLRMLAPKYGGGQRLASQIQTLHGRHRCSLPGQKRHFR